MIKCMRQDKVSFVHLRSKVFRGSWVSVGLQPGESSGHCHQTWLDKTIETIRLLKKKMQIERKKKKERNKEDSG